jgi:hypothetical protein
MPGLKPTGWGCFSKSVVSVAQVPHATIVVFVVIIAMGWALQAGHRCCLLVVAAFAVSRERRSLVVAGLLPVSGLVGVVYGLIRTEFLTASSFPGPIFGIILGVPILGLAVAEAIEATLDREN